MVELLPLAAIVITNKRILFFPVKRDGAWRESVRSAQWGDIANAQAKGFFSRMLKVSFKNGVKESYTRIRRGDAKKINAIIPALLVEGVSEISPAHGPVQLCPDCKHALTQGVYACSECNLVFKNEKTMIMRAIFLPAGGYFYTGHPFVAIVPAVVEVIFLIDVALILIAGMQQPNAMIGLLSALLVLAVFWGIETAITILHCRRYIREFIPEKRDPSRAFAAKMAG